LVLASRNGNLNEIEILFQHGANPLADKALEEIVKKSNIDALKLFKQYVQVSLAIHTENL